MGKRYKDMRYVFAYSCVTPNSLNELNHIIDNEKTISLQEFESKVDKDSYDELLKALGYNRIFSIKNDWHVTFHKSFTEKNELVYYMQHSAIEYVFKQSAK